MKRSWTCLLMINRRSHLGGLFLTGVLALSSAVGTGYVFIANSDLREAYSLSQKILNDSNPAKRRDYINELWSAYAKNPARFGEIYFSTLSGLASNIPENADEVSDMLFRNAFCRSDFETRISPKKRLRKSDMDEALRRVKNEASLLVDDQYEDTVDSKALEIAYASAIELGDREQTSVLRTKFPNYFTSWGSFDSRKYYETVRQKKRQKIGRASC